MNPHKKLTGEKYSLRWNSYRNNIINYLAEHQTSEALVDVTLICEGQYIKAHKLILSACSDYFKELFQLQLTDKPCIIFNNVNFKHLKYIIEFLYNGEIRVLDSDLADVLALASNLKVKGLSSIKEKDTENAQNIVMESTTSNKSEESVDSKSSKRNKKPLEVKSYSNKGNKSVPKINHDDLLTKQVLGFAENLDKITLGPGTKNENSRISGSSTHKKRQFIETLPIEANRSNSQSPNLDPELVDVRTELSQVDVVSVASTPTKEMSDSNDSYEFSQSDPKKKKVSKSDLPLPPLLTKSNTEDSAKTKTTAPDNTPEDSLAKPPNAFMIFTNEWRKKLEMEYPGEANKNISIRLSNMWKNLSPETKETFYEAAKKAQYEYLEKLQSSIKSDTLDL